MPPQNITLVTMEQIELTFLLPNGFIVKMTCNKKSSLGELKAPLWEKAVELPAANRLRNPDAYVFIGVTTDAAEIEFDDSLTVEELRLIYPVMEVSETKEQRDLLRLDMNVGKYSRFPSDFYRKVLNIYDRFKTELPLTRQSRNQNKLAGLSILENSHGSEVFLLLLFIYLFIYFYFLSCSANLPACKGLQKP